MIATHMEFASEVDELTCPECARQAVRLAVLVNQHGLVLATGRSCLNCGHGRHRAATRSRQDEEFPAMSGSATAA
ncbi:MAG TPA: hypothetical protein VHW44_00650 [Pseudonocardiaceae bacterium]|jgi:hypothetical protein|nr:hypothetical protein [Pseudonocardiaceae bacterium]